MRKPKDGRRFSPTLLLIAFLVTESIPPSACAQWTLRTEQTSNNQTGLEELTGALTGESMPVSALQSGLEEKFDTYEKFQQAHSNRYAAAMAAAHKKYYGDAIWEFWKAIGVLLRQKMKSDPAAWADERAADLTKLLQEDLDRLIEVYAGHYAQRGTEPVVLNLQQPLPEDIKNWVDLFVTRIDKERVSGLQQGKQIYEILRIGQAAILFETADALFSEAQTRWSIPDEGLAKRLRALKADKAVAEGNEAHRALQPQPAVTGSSV